MKVKMKKLWLPVLLMILLSVGIIFNSSAKFWGWETRSTTDWADGGCSYREICKVHYVFWIEGDEECSTETIRCL